MESSQLSNRQKFAINLNYLVRLIAPLWVFVNPVQGAILAFVTDLVDYGFLVYWHKVPRPLYEIIDKRLDFYWYCLILIFFVINDHGLYLTIAIALTFLLRLTGQLLFEKTLNDRFFLYFPNIIEPLFWVWLLLPQLIDNPTNLLFTFLIITTLKLIHELSLHHYHFDPLVALGLVSDPRKH